MLTEWMELKRLKEDSEGATSVSKIGTTAALFGWHEVDPNAEWVYPDGVSTIHPGSGISGWWMEGKPFQTQDPDERYWERNALQLTAMGQSLVWFMFLDPTIERILAGFVARKQLDMTETGYNMAAERSKDDRPASGVRRMYATRYPYDTEIWRTLTVQEEHPQQGDQAGIDEDRQSQQGSQVEDDDSVVTLTEERVQSATQAGDDNMDSTSDDETNDGQDLLDNDVVETEPGEVSDKEHKEQGHGVGGAVEG